MKQLYKLSLLALCAVFLLAHQSAQAQRLITGVVTAAEDGEGLPGVSILIKGTSQGAVTDFDGKYRLQLPDGSDQLIFSFVGFAEQTVKVNGRSIIDVQLETEVLEEVVIVGFGEQSKASLVSSVTSVNVESIKVPSSNFTNSIAGQVAGMIAFQQSGEPGLGTDNTQFFIRGLATFGSGKQNPLILIDGIESETTDMARLQPDDISDFSVLKDAAASSIYGARGANGVVLINTKMGKEGKTRYSFRAENRISSNTRNFKLADNVTFMNLSNESITTRNPDQLPRYTEFAIRNRIEGTDPYLFPSNNWIDELIRDYTWNQGYNMNISGGTGKGRFYIAGTYNLDNGVLKVDPVNDFNNNIKLQNYSIRSNVEVELSPNTKLITRIYGQFDDYSGPIGGEDENGNYVSGGQWIFRQARSANPVLFPKTYPQEKAPFIDHPLFGTAVVAFGGGGNATTLVNPYAEMVKGYQTYKRSNIMPQIELKQKLGFITEGLSFRGMSYLRRVSFKRQDRSYNPFYYLPSYNPTTGDYDIVAINDGGQFSIGTEGTEYLDFNLVDINQNSQFWLQTALDYNRVFDKHAVGGMLLGYMSHYENTTTDIDLIGSLPSRNAGLSGRFTYGYDNKYLVELNFGLNGSERFHEKNRWGLFPSAGVGYVISNEPFFDPLKSVVTNMKLRATYGIVGNDQVGLNSERFLYLSNVNLNDGGFGASFGEENGLLYNRPGISINRYANQAITWEESEQVNLGVDLGLLDSRLNLIVDVFRQTRSNILQDVSYADQVSGLLLNDDAVPKSNFGKAKSEGIDMSLDGNFRIGQELNVTLRGTFTYATSKLIKSDEIQYGPELAHLSRVGYSIKQEWGYIAERLFFDDEEVENSPIQQVTPQGELELGDVMGGDIKYRDITGDGIVNSDDMVPIGYPTQPEIIYGFGSSFLYKKFDFNFYFQGSGRSSFFIDPAAISPFRFNGGNQNNVLQAIADDHWSESNPDVYAFWPRLSNEFVTNNNQRSTWWLRNGSFLRLKRVDVGYNFGGPVLERLGIDAARLYLSGVNLMMFSKFDLWDVEMGGNGLGYPIQAVYTLGLSLDF